MGTAARLRSLENRVDLLEHPKKKAKPKEKTAAKKATKPKEGTAAKTTTK